jgi:hypothetical protein
MFQRVGFDNSDPTKHLKLVVFDRNEPFIRWMYRVFTAARERRAWWTAYVDDIHTGDASQDLPLQAADVLAWCVGRQHFRHDCQEWYDTLTWGYPPSAHTVYDCGRILEWADEAI